MDMEIVYYEQYDGVLQKVAELVVQTRNASLDTICREALGEVSAKIVSVYTRAVSYSFDMSDVLMMVWIQQRHRN